MKNVDAQALEQCDAEPIHIPGSIQEFGCLLALDKDTREIVAASENCAQYIGHEPADCIGKPINAIWDQETCHELGNKLGYSTIWGRRELCATIAMEGSSSQSEQLDLFVHSSPQFNVIECIPAMEQDRGLQDRIAAVTTGLQAAQSLEEVFELAVANVKSITNFDRVMFYRFLPDGAGEIVAERRSAHMEPYLGLRYPAWDIPKQARDLYAKVPIRTISNVHQDNIPILFSGQYDAQDLDLARATLRGTSPVHLEYLANMGVSATITIPVVVNEQLWGLVTCHNERAAAPPMHVLDAAEVAGHVISFGVSQHLQRHSLAMQSTISVIKDGFIALQTRHKTLAEFVEDLGRLASHEVEVDGLGVENDGQWVTHGTAPGGPVTLPADLSSVRSSFGGLQFSHDADQVLNDHGAETLAGLLHIPLLNDPKTAITFFRGSVADTTSWAGFPEKDIEEADGKFRLSPRKSFAKYIEDHGNRSDEWANKDIEFALNLQKECVQSQGTAGTILEQKDSLRILADELNHRVKNILALVKSITNHARDHAHSPEEYAASLENRLLSLAASHEMLTRSNLKGVDFGTIVQMELEPFLAEEGQTITLAGPDINVVPDAIPMATLLIHELTSNAVKHGVFSAARGNLSVTWTVVEGTLLIDWIESGGAPAKEPEREGFGMELLRRAIPFEFDGEAQLIFGERGFEAHYKLPISRFLGEVESAGGNEMDQTTPEEVANPPAQKRALILEDSYLLATEHANILKEIGFDNVDCVSSVAKALKSIDEHDYDFALLDINLRGEVSFSIADVLLERNVLFKFVTGYDSSTRMPEHLEQIEMVSKPLQAKKLKQALDASNT